MPPCSRIVSWFCWPLCARDLITAVSPESLRQTRWQIYQDLHGDVASSVDRSEQLLESMMREDDYRDGVQAFTEKRPPQWPSLEKP